MGKFVMNMAINSPNILLTSFIFLQARALGRLKMDTR